MQSRAVDVDSLFYASSYNPVYTINSDKTINVYPVPSSNNGFKVFYVNEEPRDISNNAALIHSHSNIKYFPNDLACSKYRMCDFQFISIDWRKILFSISFD